MNRIELDIQMLPPSPNQMRGAHWSKAHRVREDASWAVMKAWSDANRPEAPRAPASVDVVIHSHGRAGDPDNAWSRLKPILDSLVERRLLVDDSPRWLTLGTITHTKAPPRKGHVAVTITYHEEEEA